MVQHWPIEGIHKERIQQRVECDKAKSRMQWRNKAKSGMQWRKKDNNK